MYTDVTVRNKVEKQSDPYTTKLYFKPNAHQFDDSSLSPYRTTMSYTSTSAFYQTKTEARFEIIDKTVWDFGNGGRWTEANGKQVTTTGSNGVLRFRPQDECLSPSVRTTTIAGST